MSKRCIDILSTPDFKQSVFLKNIYHKSNFTVLELKEAGFTASNLIDAGFSLINIFTLGKYPYGDIKKALPSKMTDDLKEQYIVLKDKVKKICKIVSIDTRGRHYDKTCKVSGGRYYKRSRQRNNKKK